MDMTEKDAAPKKDAHLKRGDRKSFSVSPEIMKQCLAVAAIQTGLTYTQLKNSFSEYCPKEKKW